MANSPIRSQGWREHQPGRAHLASVRTPRRGSRRQAGAACGASQSQKRGEARAPRRAGPEDPQGMWAVPLCQALSHRRRVLHMKGAGMRESHKPLLTTALLLLSAAAAHLQWTLCAKLEETRNRRSRSKSTLFAAQGLKGVHVSVRQQVVLHTQKPMPRARAKLWGPRRDRLNSNKVH